MTLVSTLSSKFLKIIIRSPHNYVCIWPLTCNYSIAFADKRWFPGKINGGRGGSHGDRDERRTSWN